MYYPLEIKFIIINMKVIKKVFNEYILPVMTYGSETWALNNVMEEQLSVNQCKMRRIMLGITLRDRRHNTWIYTNIQGSKTLSPPSGEISTDGQDTWQDSQTTDRRSGLQNGLRDNGEDLEDDQERDIFTSQGPVSTTVPRALTTGTNECDIWRLLLLNINSVLKSASFCVWPIRACRTFQRQHPH